ncbi:hypothetical protein [Neobacillus sp. LXY-4]|uniref:hypothetical protein n=1 Tax=Neobacillus sp. LXY-4 TaxID=3379826 RepID=UPI003EDF2D98
MNGHFIVAKSFEHEIACSCPGGEHAELLTISKGDTFVVTHNRKHSISNGWYYLVRINDDCSFYMSLRDIEQYVFNEQLISLLDIDLKLNHLHYKINESLDTGDETSFLNFTKKLKEYTAYKIKLEEYLSGSAV